MQAGALTLFAHPQAEPWGIFTLSSASLLVRCWKPGFLGFRLKRLFGSRSTVLDPCSIEREGGLSRERVCECREAVTNTMQSFWWLGSVWWQCGPWQGPQCLVLREQWARLFTVSWSKRCVLSLDMSFQCGRSCPLIRYFCGRCYSQ